MTSCYRFHIITILLRGHFFAKSDFDILYGLMINTPGIYYVWAHGNFIKYLFQCIVHISSEPCQVHFFSKICPNLTEGIPVPRTARLLRIEASAHVSLQVGGEPILERQYETKFAAPGDSVREFQKGLGDR